MRGSPSRVFPMPFIPHGTLFSRTSASCLCLGSKCARRESSPPERRPPRTNLASLGLLPPMSTAQSSAGTWATEECLLLPDGRAPDINDEFATQDADLDIDADGPLLTQSSRLRLSPPSERPPPGVAIRAPELMPTSGVCRPCSSFIGSGAPDSCRDVAAGRRARGLHRSRSLSLLFSTWIREGAYPR